VRGGVDRDRLLEDPVSGIAGHIEGEQAGWPDGPVMTGGMTSSWKRLCRRSPAVRIRSAWQARGHARLTTAVERGGTPNSRTSSPTLVMRSSGHAGLDVPGLDGHARPRPPRC
jgi:hypothetical protein